MATNGSTAFATARNVTGGICAACRHVRALDELLIFWQIADPSHRRFVCRPSIYGGCFGLVVGTAAQHVICLATAAPELEVEPVAERLRRRPVFDPTAYLANRPVVNATSS